MPDLLTPKQLAEYLQLSERTIYRMLERGQLPAIRVGAQWRFKKSAVDYWLDILMNRMPAAELQAIRQNTGEGIALAAVLGEANARIVLPAGTRREVVGALVEHIQFPEPVDRAALVERVLEREALCSTALPDGAALLHTERWGARVLARHDLVALGRLPAPMDFEALDATPTDVLVLVLAHTDRNHLLLLAKMARLCREPDFLAGLRSAQTGAQVLTLVQGTERRVFGGASPAGGG